MYVSLGEWATPGAGHMFWKGLVALWLFSAAVSALNPPDEDSSQGYRWLFTFSHILAANLDKVATVGSFAPVPSSSADHRVTSVDREGEG